jgi:hypothetical protein
MRPRHSLRAESHQLTLTEQYYDVGGFDTIFNLLLGDNPARKSGPVGFADSKATCDHDRHAVEHGCSHTREIATPPRCQSVLRARLRDANGI